MICLFCNEDASDSKSVEHIFPESLGNKRIILGKGVICDKCNNYFAREIEKPVQSYEDIRNIAAFESIKNKKGKRKSTTLLCAGEECQLDVIENNGEKQVLVDISPEMCMRLYNGSFPEVTILKGINLSKYVNDYNFSRFVCKIALESVIYGMIENKVYDEINILKLREKYKPMIEFVRLGNRNKKLWPMKVDEIYNYIPLKDDKKIYLKGYFDEPNEDKIVFNLEFFGVRFSVNLLDNIE